MKYRKLGRSTLEISEISFGCMSLGEDHQTNKSLLHDALDCGINFFDTADIYQKGSNEITLGKAFKGMRDKIILSTKVGNELNVKGKGFSWNPSRAHILKSVDGSLRRLQTDYIDLYQLHGGTIDDPIDETIEAFEHLIQIGKIRSYGISSIRPNVIREYVSRSGIVSVMMQYSLLDRRPEETCLSLLKEHQIGVLTRGSLAKGFLAGKTISGYLNYSLEEVSALIVEMTNGKGEDQSLGDVALQFVLRHPAISSAVVGIRTKDQLEKAVRSIQTATPGSLAWEKITRKVGINTYSDHR